MRHRVAQSRQFLWSLVQPFRVGYHRRGSDVRKQDGYISSLMLFNVLLSFGVAATFGRLLSSERSEAIRKSAIKTIFSFYLLLGSVLLLVLVVSKKGQSIVSNLQRLKDSNRYKSFFHGRRLRHLPILALIIFGVGVLVIDVLQIVAYGACVDHYDQLNDQELYKEAASTILLHLVRTLFCSLIIIFAIRFPRDLQPRPMDCAGKILQDRVSTSKGYPANRSS